MDSWRLCLSLCLCSASTKVSDDDDDEWQQVYDIQDLEINGQFGKFYMTYGGGPEGGYFVTGSTIYNAESARGQPWHLERIFGMKLTFNSDGNVKLVGEDKEDIPADQQPVRASVLRFDC